MKSHSLLIEMMTNDCAIYLLSIETIFNSWYRYLLLSETMRNLRHRYAPLSETIEGLGYMCAHVGAYCIRPSIIPGKNGQSFWGLWFIRSSLTGWLWGVCNTPLHGCTYLIDVWYRCACVGAYCIRPPIGHAVAVESFGFYGMGIHPLRDGCGAYAIRPYHGTRI